ncbi:MAG: peptidylprolyl isomerase [Flavobacteriales bacterium]|nr:peptidylprolyl isomerase [Flavobacteriales bacterium]
MKIIKFLFTTSALVASTASLMAQSPIKIDGVAAVVGKEVILESDIEGAFAQYKANGIDVSDADKCKILEDFLSEKLLAYQGEVDSLELTDNEVSTQVEQKIQGLVQNLGSMKELLDFYQKPDEETLYEDMKKIVRSQMMAERMKKKVIGDIDPSPEDVRKFFNRIPKDSLPEFETEFELSTIIMKPKPTKEAVQAVIDQLKEMKKEIENGASFRTKAIMYSEDPGSAAIGGVYNNVRKGMFVKPFEAVAFNLEEGQISDPVQTEFGYHIIQVIKRKGEQLDLQHILIRPKESPDDVQKVMETMDSIVSKVRSGALTFSEAVKEFSQDDATKFNKGNMMDPNTGETSFPLSSMDAQLYYAVGSLKQGEVSDPIFLDDQREGSKYALYYVRKRSEPHRANYSMDFDKLKSMTKQEMTNKKLSQWVAKKTKDVYIYLADGWDDCNFVANWKKVDRED